MLLACPAFGQATELSKIEEISIESSEWGWGSKKGSIQIRQSEGRFLSEGRTIRSDAIRLLLARIGSTPIDEPSLEALGITSRDVMQGAEAYCRDRSRGGVPGG